MSNLVDEQAATQVLRNSPKILSTSSLGASKAEEQARSLLTKTHMVYIPSILLQLRLLVTKHHK